MKRTLPLVVLILAGCTEQRDVTAETKRTLKTVTQVTRQVIQPDGQIVELTERTVTSTNENTGETRQESTEVSPPKILGSIGQIANTIGKVAVTAVGGPAAGSLWDMLVPAITGAGTAATAGGYAVHAQIRARRKREEELEEERAEVEHALKQTVKGIEDAKDDLPEDQIKALHAALGHAQDQLVKDRVAAIRHLPPRPRA